MLKRLVLWHFPLLLCKSSDSYGISMFIEIIEIIESFGLEGTPRGHVVQPPRSEQGHR